MSTRSRRPRAPAKPPNSVKITLPPAGGIVFGWWALRVSLLAWLRRKKSVQLSLVGVAGEHVEQ